MSGVPPKLPRLPVRQTHNLIRCDYCARTYQHDNAPDTCRGCGAPVGMGGSVHKGVTPEDMVRVMLEMRYAMAMSRNMGVVGALVSVDNG